MASLRAFACGLVVLWGLPSVTAAQSEPMPVAPFRSLELRNGTHAVVRYGPIPRVTFLKGNPDETQVTIVSGDRLVVEKCKSKCTREYELEIEIVTPELGSITLAHGGWIQSRGSFPRQAEIDVTVDNGGTLDIRSMSVANVKASVLSGGRILTKPLTAMVANVVQGGNITYWGDARVTQSIQHGGVIERGNPSEADTPLPDGDSFVTPVQPIPPVPPTEPLRNRRP